jgi:hypothetical protein
VQENPAEWAVKEEDNFKPYQMILPKYIYGVLLVSLWMLPFSIYARTGDESSQVTDTAKAESKGSAHALYAGGGYGSNMIYLGSTISQDHPYGHASLSYGLKNELFATVSAVHLSGLKPYMAFYIGSVSYSHVFNKWFDISAGVYRYQVDPSLTDTLFSSFTYGDVTLGFDWKLIYTKISAGGLFSEGNQAYFQFRNSRYFQTPEFFKGKANISFDPYVNLLFGTLTEVKSTTDTAYYYSVSSPYRKWRYSGSGSTTGNPSTSTSYSYVSRFGLLEIDFGLPVALNTDFMTIEAEPSYVIPLYDDTYYPGAKGFIFSLSLFFRIF